MGTIPPIISEMMEELSERPSFLACHRANHPIYMDQEVWHEYEDALNSLRTPQVVLSDTWVEAPIGVRRLEFQGVLLIPIPRLKQRTGKKWVIPALE